MDNNKAEARNHFIAILKATSFNEAWNTNQSLFKEKEHVGWILCLVEWTGGWHNIKCHYSSVLLLAIIEWSYNL